MKRNILPFMLYIMLPMAVLALGIVVAIEVLTLVVEVCTTVLTLAMENPFFTAGFLVLGFLALIAGISLLMR